MIIPFDVNCVRSYTLKEDTSGDPTIFDLGYLDAQSAAYLQNEFTKAKIVNGSPEIQIDIANRDIEAVRLGLKGFRNFGDMQFTTTEKQYPFGKRRVITDDILNALKPYLPELSTQIISGSSMTEQEEKN